MIIILITNIFLAFFSFLTFSLRSFFSNEHKNTVQKNEIASFFFWNMPRSKELTIHEKWCIVSKYNELLTPGKSKLGNGQLELLETQTGVNKKTISKILQNYRDQVRISGLMNVNMSSKKSERVGAKSTMTTAEKRKLHRANTVTKGSASLRLLALKTGIGLSKVHRHMKKEYVTYKTKWIKPKLTDQHRKDRINHILNLRDMAKSWEFKDQKNVVVVDESWFYLCRDRTFVRVYPGEEPPPSVKVQHKKHIPKIMFLTALARPDSAHGFDGKIGIWRVQDLVTCERSNRYHRVGEQYMKDVHMDAPLYRQFMKKIMTEIKTKMHWLRGSPVIIQHDGASAHTATSNNAYFARLGKQDGWKISICTQPAQSPDLNINDLAFFRSLKCRVEYLKNGHQTLDSLYQAVQTAWSQYDPETLERIWGVQYECYRQILRLEGDNDYKTPHSGVRQRGGKINFKINKEEFKKAERWAHNH